MTELNRANRIYLGGAQASAAYAGSTKVWPMGFRPTDIPGCAVWIDASKTAYWTNLGSGSQPKINGAPRLRTNALNGMSVIRIDQGFGNFRWYSGTGVDKDYTIIYVGRRWSLKPGRIVTAYGSAANLLIGFHGYEMDMCYDEGWITNAQAPPSTTHWKLYSADSTSTGPARFFKDGALYASGTATPANGWGGTLCISGYFDDPNVGASQECDCEVAELIQYNRKISDAERQQAENYLRAKWLSKTLWKPTDLGGNLLGWFDSSDMASVQLSGSGVTNWVNRGAGGMAVGQATAGYMPTYLSTGGVNFALGQGMSASGGPASFDVIVVAKPNPPAAAPVNWRTMLRSTQGHEIILEDGSTRLGIYNAGFQPAGGLTWPQVDGFMFARVAPSSAVWMSRDGGALNATAPLAAGSAAPIMFGCYLGPDPTQAFGLVKEVIFVPYNLESARQMLEGYVAWKWGLDPLLAAGHPYRGAPP